MRMFALVLLSLIALGPVQPIQAQGERTKRDAQGPVTVAVTLLDAPRAGVPIRVKVALDTHSVDLSRVAFERVVALRTASGTEVLPTAVEQVSGGGHHREATIVFSPTSERVLHIVVKDVGGVAERLFSWPLPAE